MFDSYTPYADPTPDDEEQRRQKLRQMVLGQQQQQQQVPDVSPVSATMPNAPVGLTRSAPADHAPAVTLMPPDHADPTAASAAPVLTGSAKARADATAFDAAPAKHIQGFWRRLGAGINKGLQTYREGGGPQNAGGLIGSLIGGGAYGAASSKGLDQWAKDRQSKQLWAKYGTALQTDTADQKYQQEVQKTQGEGLKNAKTGVDLQQQIAEPYIKAASAKGYMTPDEVNHVKTTFGVDITDPNNGRFETETRNGKTYVRRINDPAYVENPTIPTELGNQYYDTQLPGQDQTVPLKPGQVATTAVGVAQANAGREERAGQRSAQVDEKNYESQQQYQTRQTKARADAANANAALQTLQAARDEAAQNGSPTSAIDARIADAKGKLAAAQTSLQEKFTPRPKNTPQVFSEADARQYYQSKGKSKAEIDALIQKGRGSGVIR